MADWLDIKLLAVDHLEVIDLSAKARLTAYDAFYLWLARKTGGELEGCPSTFPIEPPEDPLFTS